MTVGQRWRFRRNLVIALAHKHGASQRLLADVFDLPRSRIAAILAELAELHDVSEADATDRAEGPPRAFPPRRAGRATVSVH